MNSYTNVNINLFYGKKTVFCVSVFPLTKKIYTVSSPNLKSVLKAKCIYDVGVWKVKNLKNESN